MRTEKIKSGKSIYVLVTGYTLIRKTTRAFTTNWIAESALIFLDEWVKVRVFSFFTCLSAYLTFRIYDVLSKN